MNNKHILFTLLLSTTLFALQGQTLEDARSWYLNGRYADALHIFQEEYSKDPTNPALNQWLGVSLLKTGKLTEAVKYLTFADEKKIPDATLYLGELYSKLYRFDDAEKAYEKYQKVQRRNKDALARLELFREESAQLQRRVLRTEDVQIIDSLVLPKKEFLEAYNLGKSSGSLQTLQEFFKDSNITDQTLYINGRGDKIYYSKGDESTGIDLYTMDKLLDRFGNEKKLPASINEEGNQAYPFVMNDGLTIYFASTGHGSLGGYDLFVTRYNLSSDSYLTPNQLNMPFNSFFNDYLMVIDEEKGVGWFASDRFQPADSVCVYTFIPNTQVTLLENDDLTYMSNRARISAIADTWRPGVDYSSLIETARQKIESLEKPDMDFTFVINDQFTYHTLNDFKTPEARQTFSQALTLENQWEELQQSLSQERDQFAKDNNQEALRTSILSKEKESDRLYREIQRLKRAARNEEIRANYSQY
jgi:hypothetical protein